MSLTLSILNTYFSIVKPLNLYLDSVIAQDRHCDVISTNDTAAYHDFVKTTYVALKRSGSADLRNGASSTILPSSFSSMSDIIENAQHQLLKASRTQNIITAGYRQAGNWERGKKAGRMSITNRHINTIVTALHGQEWETLLQRIGSHAMLHLLAETSIFVALPNNCLCQVTGEPIIFMTPMTRDVIPPAAFETAHRSSVKRKLFGPHTDGPPMKRQKLEKAALLKSRPDKASGNPQLQLTPIDISFARARIFYARPARLRNTNRIAIGLPPRHILNRLNPSYSRKVMVEPYTDPDPSGLVRDARHLSKYIFPRQYGLPTPLGSTQQKKSGFVLPSYIDREKEIETLGRCKTPKRLKDVLSMLEQINWRHKKCGYMPLRNLACPSKITNKDNKQLDKSVILELMSEQSSYLRSQAAEGNTSVDSNGARISAHGLTQAERHAKTKPRFSEFTCTHVEVYRYAALVTKAVIPSEFWGSKHNFKLILRRVKDIISCQRFETLTLHDALQGFRTADCEWLMPPGEAVMKQSHVSITDALKRRELLEEFLFWYFDSFILPLLKTTFYITESSAFRNQVLYFRQDDWEVLCSPLIAELSCNTFQKIEKAEAEAILQQRKLGFSFVRLLPKDTGVRPIVNLRRSRSDAKGKDKGTAFHSEQSINQILQATFHILTYEKQAQPSLVGASIFGANEVYARLKDLKSRLPRDAKGNLPSLYFVKLDVKACFDTIKQSKLLEILREILSEDAYTIQKYGQVSCTAGKSRRSFLQKAIPIDEQPHFLTFAAELAGLLRHTIFVDQVIYRHETREKILELLEQHITENIVKIGNDYYRQAVGIPQGSTLSTLLCSFFYGDLEKRFGRFSKDLQSALFRLVDDYLFITTDLSKARRFLEMMSQGFPEYGCSISPEKTLTNFDHGPDVTGVIDAQQQSFPWCGFQINLRDLSVTVDYSRYDGIDLSWTLTVHRGRRPGAAFLHKMLQLCKARTNVIFWDTNLNSEHVMNLNIYQNFLLSAMKMHRYIRAWGLDPQKAATFVRNTIQQMVGYFYAAMRNRITGKFAAEHGATCNATKATVTWLGTMAFYTVLSQKPERYRAVLKALRFDLSLPRYRSYKQQYRVVVSQGLENMNMVF